MKMKTYAKAKEVDEYFALPKKERQNKWGWYLAPMALPFSGISSQKEEKGWAEWSQQIRKEYPIQGFFREWVFSYDNPVYGFLSRLKTRLSTFYYTVCHWIKPCHPRFQKVYPRGEWNDLCNVIEDSLFAIVLDFWYQEIKQDTVNWSAFDTQKKFFDELKECLYYLEVTRKKFETSIDALYEKLDYAAIELIEKEQTELKTKWLTWVVNNREFFWT